MLLLSLGLPDEGCRSSNQCNITAWAGKVKILGKQKGLREGDLEALSLSIRRIKLPYG